MEKELSDKIYYFIKKKKTPDEICKTLEISNAELIGLVKLMNESGYMCDYTNGEMVILKKPIQKDEVYEIPHKLEKLKMLLISDTHLCSKYDRLDILRYLYDKAEDKGITHILHSGDFTDGRSNRPEHIYELKDPSYEGQVEYCVDKYPRYSGKTYVISGNHDDWWYKSNGSEIVKSIARQRDDIVYLGTDIADMKIGKTKIRLFHGTTQSYAKSYKLQRYLETIPTEDRPDILQTGHIHSSFYMKQDKTHCFQTGCLEDLTPYAKSKGFEGDKSAWWVELELDDKGNIHTITPQLETFSKKLKR